MSVNRMNAIVKKAMEFDIPVVAIADDERLNSNAPADYLPGARSVVVFARQLPTSVFAPDDE